jgi:hypothetical protein
MHRTQITPRKIAELELLTAPEGHIEARGIHQYYWKGPDEEDYGSIVHLNIDVVERPSEENDLDEPRSWRPGWYLVTELHGVEGPFDDVMGARDFAGAYDPYEEA